MFFFSGMVFLMEYMIQVDRDSGLSGHTYDLLGNLSLVCSASCLILSLQPIAFFAEVALSCGLVFKGTWILQCGFSLFTSGFMPKGCQRVSELPSYDKSSIKCELEEDGLRGMALIDLLFVGHAIGVMLFSFLLFGYLSFGQNLRYGSGSTESDAMLMRPLPEFEIE
ncbi:hypothetical protein AMTR_s00067p00202560 [Amborella trichopoda]|uniref:Uncharacterized protein n=2 Tax=Amborella trichopoda TaxID=13333 RepID=U5DEW2_AMBTC|nr:hypothetical protein AMTR_s00067p00202560 [Amborella trichopoda]